MNPFFFPLHYIHGFILVLYVLFSYDSHVNLLIWTVATPHRLIAKRKHHNKTKIY